MSEPETRPCSQPSSVPCVVIVKNKDSVKTAVRPVGAKWQAPVTLISAEGAGEPQIVLDRAGNATALWRAIGAGRNRTIESSLRPNGGTWQTPVTLAVTPLRYLANELDTSLQLATDAQGEVTAAWVHEYTGANEGLSGITVVETAVRGVDGSWKAPSVISGRERRAEGVHLAENASGTAAAVWACPVTTGLHLYPFIVRGAIRPTASAEWRPVVDISAGKTTSPDVAISLDGRAVAVWNQVGPVTATGLYASLYETGLGGPGVPQGDECPPAASPTVASASAPVLSRVRMTNTRFHVTRAPTAVNAKTTFGTAFLFNLSTTGSVSIALSRLTTGLKHGRLCIVARTRALRRVHAKRCRRTVGIATLTRRSEPAGEDRVAFTGRVGWRSLKPGDYAARLTAANVAGRSSSAVVRFAITR